MSFVSNLPCISQTSLPLSDQPEDAIKTIRRVIVGMGIEATKIKPGTVHEVILKIMVIATTCASWLSELIRRNDVQQKTVRHILPVAHSIILCLAFLTEATVSFSLSWFQFCRILQTTLMGQYVLLHPSSNSKLSALLRGTFCHGLFTFATLDQFMEVTQHFFACEAVYVRFSHIAGFQPKFYIGSTSSFILDREHSRFQKFLQVRQNKYVLAEVARVVQWNLCKKFGCNATELGIWLL